MSKWNDVGRVCSKCAIFKPWADFSQKSSQRYGKVQTELHKVRQPRCKTCCKADTQAWKDKQTPERIKDLYYTRFYGISYLEFQQMLNAQSGACKICGRVMELLSHTGSSVVVDHCHTSGRVRGLLCNECNRGLGYFKDNKMSLQKAIEYLSEQGLRSEGGQ